MWRILNWHGNLLINEENLSQGKNLIVILKIVTSDLWSRIIPSSNYLEGRHKTRPQVHLPSIKCAKNTCPSATITSLCLSTLLGSFPVFLVFFYGNKTYVQVLLPIALISMMIAYITLSVTMLPNGLSLFIVCLITMGIFAYCVLAIEVVKKIVQIIYGFAAERASHILTLARREWKPSSAMYPKKKLDQLGLMIILWILSLLWTLMYSTLFICFLFFWVKYLSTF